MLTGDNKTTAETVAKKLGIDDVVAEVLPDQKLALVDDLKRRGHQVCVVGDGVNDAPALAAGHLGIAMGAAGSDVAINSASVALMNNDLNRIPFLIRLSRKTTAVIWQNLLFGVAFILVTQSLAIWGSLRPIMAAFLHTIATTIVIFNSARLVRFGEELEPHVATGAPPPGEEPHRLVPAPAVAG